MILGEQEVIPDCNLVQAFLRKMVVTEWRTDKQTQNEVVL